MMYTVGERVVILPTTHHLSSCSFDVFEHISECKAGKVLRCYQGDEDYSHHGSPWYATCVDVELTDGSIYHYNNIETVRYFLCSYDTLMKTASSTMQRILSKVHELKREGEKYPKVVEQIQSLWAEDKPVTLDREVEL